MENSIPAVLKTVDPTGRAGANPAPSAKMERCRNGSEAAWKAVCV